MTKLASRFRELAILIPEFEIHAENSILEATKSISHAFMTGNKVLICGNGGSAADSQHFATEFMNSFSPDLNRPGLAAIALTTDTSFLTAHANDFQFQTVFRRQVATLGKKGDVLIAITTSGESLNCIEAVNCANEMGLRTISFSKQGGEITKSTHIALEIASSNTQHIQELHLISYHIIVEMVEAFLFR